jgi:hypothetical protein
VEDSGSEEKGEDLVGLGVGREEGNSILRGPRRFSGWYCEQERHVRG